MSLTGPLGLPLALFGSTIPAILKVLQRFSLLLSHQIQVLNVLLVYSRKVRFDFLSYKIQTRVVFNFFEFALICCCYK